MRLVVVMNDLHGGEYAEPYAGGAGVALNLLFGGYVSRIRINDRDPSIAAFWRVATAHAGELCDFIETVELSVDEWHRQRAIYQDSNTNLLARACATFYLNRTNRSGIIKSGGIIGGLDQTGKWKIDARFNRGDLAQRVRRIADKSSQIEVTDLDALDFLETLPRERLLCYLDPPYYRKASELYANFYLPSDHAAVAQAVHGLSCPWIVSYDNTQEIRRLYSDFSDIRYDLRYTARKRYEGKEIMFFSPGLKVPEIEVARTPEASEEADVRRFKAPPQIKRRDVKEALLEVGAAVSL